MRRIVLRGALLAGLAVCLATALPVAVLRLLPPPTTAFMLRARFGDDPTPVHYQWVAWERISPNARLAVVAAEDQKFPRHHGFDLASIADAVSAGGGRPRGASTLSQQVAKNLFLWPERSLVRKALEAWITAWIELLWPKRRILEVHLNVAEFGRGVFGVEAAARRFFGRSASSLSADEAALLAAVLPNPKRLRVHEPSAYVRGRQRWIRSQMRQLGAGYLADI